MDTTEKITRRSLAGLLLAGVTLPAAKTFATHHRGVDAHITTDPDGVIVVVTSFSGVIFTAEFACDLLIGSGGSARGKINFISVMNHTYVAEVGGLDFDAAGNSIRAWVLMRERLSDGLLAQDWALASITPSASRDIYLEYDFMSGGSHLEPVRFEAPGTFEIGQR